jgi:hypothetical protein
MDQCTTTATTHRFSPCASLAAIGHHLRHLDLFGPVRQQVQIRQKTIKHAPTDKLYDAFIGLLAGVHGLVEINTRLRNDPALQHAFGRTACAEQSVVQDTLNACTEANVAQLAQALGAIYRRHGQGYYHNYQAQWQVLDIDMMGWPCGRQAEQATKGYFAKQRNRRGRQLGRVLATWYDEIVVDQLFPGTTQLTGAFEGLVVAAEQVLELDESKRRRTILRMDAGGGSVDDINWALQRGYQVHTKEYSGRRARALAEQVEHWETDPFVPGRQVGWVTGRDERYVQPVTRVAVRCRKQNGQWGVGVIVSSLYARDVIGLRGQDLSAVHDPLAVLLAYVHVYDMRGGGVETAHKEDKQGLGMTKRNKKRFAAQQMLVHLGALAHNVTVWARRWVMAAAPKVAALGIKRLVRDVWQVSGQLVFGADGRLQHVVLNQADPFAASLVAGLTALFQSQDLVISLGQT